MIARVLPMPAPFERLPYLMNVLAGAEARYLAAKERRADALTLLGLATVNGTLTVAHKHEAESAEQECFTATLERDAAVALLLRAR